MGFIKEIEREKQLSQSKNWRLAVLEVEAKRPVLANRKLVMATRAFAHDLDLNFNNFSFAKARQVYKQVCRHLNFKLAEATSKTWHESEIAKTLESHTKLKIEYGCWIGHRNVDLFIPSLLSPGRGGFRGLVIEVNGGVHNKELKMKKDTSKELMLHNLRIALVTIENQDHRSPQVRALLKDIKNLDRLDDRGRKRVWYRIYLETIACYATNQEIADLIGSDYLKFLDLLALNNRGSHHA